MADRKPFIGGNWKMNLHADEAAALARALVDGLTDAPAEVAICPAFPYLHQVGEILSQAQSKIQLGAQDVHTDPNGAFTGEVSCSMLRDVGATVVIVGHSERRHVLAESDVLINAKVRAALDAGLDVIFCIGETLQQREAGMTDAVNWGQIGYGLAGVSSDHMARVTIAYEPVWAIGTGMTATPDDAQAAHQAIRAFIRCGMFNDAVADRVRIQYGGSVKPDNAAQLFAQPDIDGGLIGGAALKADDFLAIIAATQTVAASAG
ncbi:MAG: triose-phosphate isomerase [Planctomycetaceae bacterium]|nr:triose-phosphate isomerase [Planctomycetaceae bacterium]